MIDHLSTTPSLPMILRQPPPAPSLSRRVFMARRWLVGGVTCLGALLIPATSRSASLDPAAGELIANAPHMPVHLGSMSESIKTVIERNPGMRAGDVYVLNDPYHGGTHLPDITMVSPVFVGDAVRFFVASRARTMPSMLAPGCGASG